MVIFHDPLPSLRSCPPPRNGIPMSTTMQDSVMSSVLRPRRVLLSAHVRTPVEDANRSFLPLCLESSHRPAPSSPSRAQSETKPFFRVMLPAYLLKHDQDNRVSTTQVLMAHHNCYPFPSISLCASTNHRTNGTATSPTAMKITMIS